MESEGTSISLLKHQDFYLFQDLIKSSWSENHIFAKNRSVFDWQHKGPSNYYYMSAKKEKEIIAAQGIIPQNHFDESLPADQIFLAFWIAKKKTEIAIGLQCYKKIIEEFKPELIGGLGMNPRLIHFHRWQNFKISLMDHHVFLSPYLKKYKIATVPPSLSIKRGKVNSGTSFERVTENDIANLDTSHLYDYQIPTKSDLYIKNRYILHPFYNYEVYAIKKESQIKALCVIRPISIKGSKLLRFVDFIGPNDAFGYIYEFVSSIIYEHNAEYVDLYSYGVPSKILKKASFIKRDTVKGLVIPNHFEPFENKNIDITAVYKTQNSFQPVRFFKGDSDQDRPNFIKTEKKFINSK